jgi:hypothetical protein
MKLEVKGNKNYCATIVQIDNKIDLEGCDNICGTTIFGNHIIISKDIEVGQVGIYFPVECSIKDVFLKVNNLYRDKTLNEDQTKSGFFELNGRVRCMKLRGFKSEGFFIPIESLFWIVKDIDIKIGDEFDYIDDMMICEKYVIKSKKQEQVNKSNKKSKIKKISKLLDGYFRLHIDTEQFGKNLHKFKLDDFISITEKIHGCSFISSNILCKRKLTLKDKIAKFLGAKIIETEFDNIYSSRRVIKNEFEDNKVTHFYNEDIWGIVNNELKNFLTKGMTIYGEVCGFLSNGEAIQKIGPYIYDYGCKPKEHKIYIYRITLTDNDGKVFEWSMKQIQDWCKEKGLNAVPLHYYGTVKNFIQFTGINGSFIDDKNYQNQFLETIVNTYLERDCYICSNKVPAEGVCIRKEINYIEVYKAKAFKFRNAETVSLDKGEENIEDNQEEEN